MDQALVIVLIALGLSALIFAVTELVQRQRRAGQVASRLPATRSPALEDGENGLLEPVRYFRQLGFFAAQASLSDAALADWLAARIDEDWGARLADLARTREQADLYLLLQDQQRVYLAPDKYFYPGEDGYLDIIRRCARLTPEDTGLEPLQEDWLTDEGPVDVHFTARGRSHLFTAADPKYLDARLFERLNEAIAPSLGKFFVSDALGMPNVVLLLSDAEARRLREERGWSFWPG